MENQVIEFTIWFIAIVWILTGIFRILYPNYFLKQHMIGAIKMPRDTLTRFGGIFTMVWGLYILSYVLGYIK